MLKKWLGLVVFILAIPIAYSLASIVVNETELVAIQPLFQDPDGDLLEYEYSYPLNEEGEWQTNYGDEGEYIIAIAASDGKLSTEEQAIITVKRKEEPPELEYYEPYDTEVSVIEGKSILFTGEASDKNKDEIVYEWYLDGVRVAEGMTYEYYADYFNQGKHIVKLAVSDEVFQVEKEWILNVEDLDRTKILDEIEDVEIYETDVVKLKLPDFEAYNLEYEISEPIGNENMWKTTYDDDGEYIVTVTIRDRSFEYSKGINVVVKNIDRRPTMEPISDRRVSEGEEVLIYVKANDPDNDPMTYSVIGAPEGAQFSDGVFRWTPSRDYIMKRGLWSKLMDKFHILSRTEKMVFVAEGSEYSIKKKVKVRVFDDNRAPVIEDMGPIVINEGEYAFIEPNAYDLDNDKVSVSFSGWMDNPKKATGFEDAGTYVTTIEAFDGRSFARKNVTIIVNNVNRAPLIEEIPRHDINEGEELEFNINCSDPDGDLVTASIEEGPSGADVDDNVFLWTPGYDEADKLEIKEYTVEFVATDGELEARKNSKILVHHTNRAPEVINVSPIIGKFALYEDSAVVFQVLAEDPDGDDLNYQWVFGRSKYKGGPAHMRTFTKPGKKDVKVIISDGDYSLSVTWTVTVLERVVVEEELDPKVVTSIVQQPAQTVQTTEQTAQTTQTTQTTEQVTQPTQPTQGQFVTYTA